MSPGSARASRPETVGLLKSCSKLSIKIEPRGPDGTFTFIWNNRTCVGNELHAAALNNDWQTAETILDANPELLASRFTYETFFNNVAQEGSGEAIHLAASRDAVDVVKCLLQHGAKLDSAVTRNHKNHYDVLHAAVFAEGRGGTERMIRLLLHNNAKVVPNLDKRWPLHLAFQVGQVKLIGILRKAMQAQGVLEEAERDNGDVPSPLKVGIQMRKLSEEQLSQVAALTPESLLALIHYEPACIPSFLKRMETEEGIEAEALAELIKVSDLSKLLGECAEAADALISALMETPTCASEGWHPLPSRISFAPRSIFQRLQDVLNPPRERYPLYVPDMSWDYDTKAFKAPAWHQQLTDTKLNRPIRDVRIKVCKVPNIICAEVLAALCHAADDDTLFIFNNEGIRCMLEYVWWRGAIKVDVLQVFLSIWGLALLVLECWLVNVYGRKVSSVSSDFISARALVDFGHELVQFIGYVKIGRTRDYIDWGNAYDIFRCTLPAMLFYDRDNRVVHVLVILIYWMRLLEVNFSESMSRELLPITRLARGLLPASIVAFIGFCGLTHAFYALGELDGDLGGDVLLNSFAMLITGAIPQSSHLDDLRLFLTYTSVLMFTVFFLNIFIGVIGENYSIQKGLSPLVFQNVRSGICCAYILRASVIPAWLCSPICAGFASLFAAVGAMALQVLAIFSDAVVPHLSVCFFICLAVMILSTYQNPVAPWARLSLGEKEREPHYLWSVEAFHPEPPSQLDRMQNCLDEMRELLDEQREAKFDMSPTRSNRSPASYATTRRPTRRSSPEREHERLSEPSARHGTLRSPASSLCN